MREPQFDLYDEVLIFSKDKYGVIIDFVYIEEEDIYCYSVDCEEELLECRENELQLA
jgi:hypothetical protein